MILEQYNLVEASLYLDSEGVILVYCPACAYEVAQIWI